MHLFPQVVGSPLPYDDLNAIRQRLTEVAPNLTRYGSAEDANYFAQATELSKVWLCSIPPTPTKSRKKRKKHLTVYKRCILI